MNLDFLKTLISEIVLSEIGETNVKQFGSDSLMGKITSQLTSIVAKYGGDHDKAFASPEWKKATEDADASIGKEKTAALLGAQPIQQPPQSVFNKSNNPGTGAGTGTTPTASTGAPSAGNNRPNTAARVQALRTTANKTDPSQATQANLNAQNQTRLDKQRQRLQALRVQKPKIQERKNSMKKSNIAQVISEVARRVLLEEIEVLDKELKEELRKLGGSSAGSLNEGIFAYPEAHFPQRTGTEGRREGDEDRFNNPSHGDTVTDNEGEEYTYNAEWSAWLSPHEWQEWLDSSGTPDDLGDSGEVLPVSSREEEIDSLLMMEFEGSGKISMPMLESLVRKNIRKTLRGEK